MENLQLLLLQIVLNLKQELFKRINLRIDKYINIIKEQIKRVKILEKNKQNEIINKIEQEEKRM